MQTILRKDAKVKGLKRYFTGKPCKHGHVAERRVSDGKCTKCKEKQDSEYFKEYASIYYAKNKEKVKARVEKWRLENPDRTRNNNTTYKRNNRLRTNECARNWRRNNIERARITGRRHVHARRTAEGTFTAADINGLFENQGGKCLTCDAIFSTNNPYTIDHDTPVSRGGSNWPSNLNLLCKGCNSSKGASTLQEYVTRLRNINKAN
jgi:5-methylcytosine-specific restriction endonuclease McrA